MYINRLIENELEKLKTQFPVITITGPRQSGKTTLAKNFFSGYTYYSLESPDIRLIVSSDTRRFIENNLQNTIIDEVQNYPQILSYLQEYIDAGAIKNWIITGSMAFEMLQNLTQTLAGRTGIIRLYPFSLTEIKSYAQNKSSEELIVNGFYPSVVTGQKLPKYFYENYVATYLERDVRQIINIRHFTQFQRFLYLLAGRSGNILNTSSLASDVGVSSHTIQTWINALEAMFLTFPLPSFNTNIRKRLIKSPKYYFIDTGLVCYLLGLWDPQLIWKLPVYGQLFENMVISEIKKSIEHKKLPFKIYFYRENKGIEIDLIIETPVSLNAIEIKSSKTFNSSFTTNLVKFDTKFSNFLKGKTFGQFVLYDGAQNFNINNIQILNFKDFILNVLETL